MKTTFLTMVVVGAAFCSAAQAQGFLPPVPSSATPAVTEMAHPLLIGEQAPEFLTVIDENNKKRNLLSYKSYLDILVVTFFSHPCEAGQTLWPHFRRLNDRYKDWRVSYLAVNVSAAETESQLLATLKNQKLPWPVVQDDQKTLAAQLHVMSAPQVLIFDESAVLRYRGPVEHAAAALIDVIGRTESVNRPEPPMTSGCAL